MNKHVVILLLTFILVGCQKQDPKEQLQHLNGYWEISKVEFSKDSIREFTMSEDVDYFELKNEKGFRKKVRPQYDGTYKITNTAEEVIAKTEEGKLMLYYTTPFNSWKETVLKADEGELQIKNERDFIYHYKRYTPLLENYNEEEE